MKQFKDLSSKVENFPASLFNEGVKLVKVGYQKGTKNNPNQEFISFTFQSNSNKVTNMLTDNMLVPSYQFCTKDIPRQNGTMYTVQDQKDTVDMQFLSRLLQVATAYGVDREAIFELKYDSWKELGEKYSELVLSNMDKEIKCYMKTVKNKGGYTSLPQKGSFLRNMESGKPDWSYTDKEQAILDSFNGEGVEQKENLEL